jgi:hypothetical protein
MHLGCSGKLAHVMDSLIGTKRFVPATLGDPGRRLQMALSLPAGVLLRGCRRRAR